MSVQATCKTVINDEAALIDALKDIYGNDAVKTHAAGLDVTGYSSVRKPTITVQVPGLHGTAGFCKGTDGSYELVYDSWDAKRLTDLIPQKKGKVTVNRLAQVYAKQKVMKAMKDLRARVIKDETNAEGAIKMRLRVTQY